MEGSTVGTVEHRAARYATAEAGTHVKMDSEMELAAGEADDREDR